MASVRGIRCVDVAVGNLEETSRFYGGIWGLEEVARSKDARYFRGTAHYHHVFALFERSKPALLRIVLDAADRATVDQLHQAVVAAGVGAVEDPRELTRPGGGYGFGFKDPEGRNLAIVCDVADHRDAGIKADRPIKVTHVNLNSAAAAQTCPFYLDTLGFRLSDESDLFFFLRCNSDHHAILLAKMTESTLNHISFEMADLDSVMRGAGRLKDHGYPIEWGPSATSQGRKSCPSSTPPTLSKSTKRTSRTDQNTGNGRQAARTAGASPSHARRASNASRTSIDSRTTTASKVDSGSTTGRPRAGSCPPRQIN
jgi:catechol 2,3-dioxygenase-like lactoylglutathione lyase family enzyme